MIERLKHYQTLLSFLVRQNKKNQPADKNT
jgi:hypothetical protein